MILIFSFVLFKNQSRVIDRLGICRSGLLPALDSLAFLLRFHHSKISYLVARRGFTGCGQRISSLTAFCCHQNFIFENISGSYLKNIESVPGNILHFNSWIKTQCQKVCASVTWFWSLVESLSLTCSAVYCLPPISSFEKWQLQYLHRIVVGIKWRDRCKVLGTAPWTL